MNTLDILLLLLAAAAFLSAAGVILWKNRNTRRSLNRMNEMLDAAINGTFHEKSYDESLLSAVESRLARYLSASLVSARNLSMEKDKIKALISDISHQTKTPLANILLYAQLLGEQPLSEEGLTCVTALNQQSEKLKFLIEALVKTSRLEAGVFALQPKTAAIQPILDDIEGQISPKASAKKITVTTVPTTEKASFDAKWTTEALYNLVDNAVKYTPVGGRIHIRVTPYELFCRIDITDTGMGIPEEEHSKIFQRFYRSPSAGDVEGVGIGLYLTRQIITGEGGYLKVESARGKGTTFSVFLLRNL